MRITSNSFQPDGPIPAEFAFARPHPETHVTLSSNRNPHLAWSDAPAGTKSFALICVDTDVPTKPDDVNQEGRSVPADLPRTDFHHWVMIDIPTTCTEIAAGACSDGVTAGGKTDPAGPPGSRQGVNNFTEWFAGDANMGGTYLGYDGPAPPWNDELVHHYHFRVYALDIERLPVEGKFVAADVLEAMEDHVLGEAEIVGTYTQNVELVGT